MNAQSRDVDKMKSVAQQALIESGEPRASHSVPRELRKLTHCSVVGYADGQFAVVSADGSRVLGVTTMPSGIDGPNPAFEWWLQAANEALGRQGAPPREERLRPDPKKVPIEVAPMVATHWGQIDPYYRLCPVDSFGERSATGCVATSMAQVLNFYQQPERGVGQRTIWYPYRDSISGTPVNFDFENTYFRWDLTNVENFKTQTFSEDQAEAISTLMLACGVAADMRYNGEAHGGSGTTAAAAAAGFRQYLQMPEARCEFRENYESREWVDMVYDEISTGHPIIYGGQAYTGGHSFILHGYNRQGLVYVNWGWNGDSEGYFDINLLNPGGGTNFSDSQDMILGLCPTVLSSARIDIQVPVEGSLASQLAAREIPLGSQLVVGGPLNDEDFLALRQKVQACGPFSLDLSEAQIDELPSLALNGCYQLRSLVLPPTLKHIGDGALGDLRYLTDLKITPASDADFVLEDGIIYNKEKTEIICALSTIEGELAIPSTITSIHPYAFSGCVLLTQVELPATITKLGAETFRNCYWLEKLKVRSKEVVALQGYDVFEGVDLANSVLQVPSGLKSTYSRRAQWKEFHSVEEFGTTVKARNAVRRQGESNPEFGYEIAGDAIVGKPYLYTDATPESAPGVYTIYCEPGTITAPDVEYVNGRLIVEVATAVTAVSTTQKTAQQYDLQGYPVSTNQGRPRVVLDRRADGKVFKHITQ